MTTSALSKTMIDLPGNQAISPSLQSLRAHFESRDGQISTNPIENADSLSFRKLHEQIRAHAAVLIPIITRNEELHVLLTRRAEHLKYHPGEVSFPGGKIEAQDDSETEAAIREAEEEIGLTADKIEVLGRLGDYFTLHGVCITPVVALVKEPVKLTADPNEVSDIFQVPLDYLLDPNVYDSRSHEHNGITRRYYSAFYEERHIWGVTAGIVMGLYQELLSSHR